MLQSTSYKELAIVTHLLIIVQSQARDDGCHTFDGSNTFNGVPKVQVRDVLTLFKQQGSLLR